MESLLSTEFDDIDSPNLSHFDYKVAYWLSIKMGRYAHMQWHSYTGAHWGTGPTISLCGPTMNILTYHVHSVHSNICIYFIYA